jgi:hypothetical protein
MRAGRSQKALDPLSLMEEQKSKGSRLRSQKLQFQTHQDNASTMPSSTVKTSTMYIAIFDGHEAAANFSRNLKCLPDKDFSKLVKAVDESISKAAMKDVTMLVTFISDVFFPDTDFDNLIHHLNANKNVKKIVTKMPDCIVLATNEGFIVTIRLIGAKKFTGLESESEEDDSFEVAEDLTQKMSGLDTFSNYYSTPRK